jgi:hypothetical protein
MLQMRNVQGEACHGPTNQTPHQTSTAIDYHSEVCGRCHTGQAGRHTYEEWESCSHSQSLPPAQQQLACTKCHEAQSANSFLKTGLPPITLPENAVWQLTCSSCHGSHERDLFGHQLFQTGGRLPVCIRSTSMGRLWRQESTFTSCRPGNSAHEARWR